MNGPKTVIYFFNCEADVFRNYSDPVLLLLPYFSTKKYSFHGYDR